MCASYIAPGTTAKFAFFQGYGNILLGIKGGDRFPDDLDALHADNRKTLKVALALLGIPVAAVLFGLMQDKGDGWPFFLAAGTVGLIPAIKGVVLLYATLKLKMPSREEFNQLFA